MALSFCIPAATILAIVYFVIAALVVYFAIKATIIDPTDPTVYAERKAR